MALIVVLSRGILFMKPDITDLLYGGFRFSFAAQCERKILWMTECIISKQIIQNNFLGWLEIRSLKTKLNKWIHCYKNLDIFLHYWQILQAFPVRCAHSTHALSIHSSS